MVRGLREGATEDAAVAGELLSDLLTRGLDFTETRLYVLDGSKALQRLRDVRVRHAKRALNKIHHELMHLNPSAARSLEEEWRRRLPFTNCVYP